MSTVEPQDISEAQWRAYYRKKFEAAVDVAWMRRNGPSGVPEPFDTGAEFMEITDDFEVYPLWGYLGDDGAVRSWGNAPSRRAKTAGAWRWVDTNPTSEWASAHEDEEWMGSLEGDEDGEYITEVSWVIDGPHDQPPPVPEAVIDYLVAVQGAFK